MINKKEALDIALEQIKSRNEFYLKVDSISDVRDSIEKIIPYGEFEGLKKDVYSISYSTSWGILFVVIDSESGKPLYTLTPHGYLD